MNPLILITVGFTKTRKKRGPPKPKMHIKMVQGLKEWNPVDIFKNTPVTGLNVGNLLPLLRGAKN